LRKNIDDEDESPLLGLSGILIALNAVKRQYTTR